MVHTRVVSLQTYGGWSGILRQLVARQDLPAQVADAAMNEILQGQATSAQIAAFAVALRAKGETTDELKGLLTAMRSAAVKVPLDAPALGIIDTCGTGGDHSGSINVSTAAALVAVGAGAKVCKHGNRSVSSLCGSADVLEALGAVIDLGPNEVAHCVEQTGFGFCLAPLFHPAMRHAAAPRRELGIASVFNFLGPLVNPAEVNRQLVGISDPNMAAPMLEVLRVTGSVRVMIVHGHGGLDELSTIGLTQVWELRHGEIIHHFVDPTSLGFAPAHSADLVGGDADANARCLQRVLNAEVSPQRDIVVLNAAAALCVADVCDTLEQGVQLAEVALETGAAGAVLDSFVVATQELKNQYG
ncbi:MAG: anthranilate phosphoribosyltransferase [Acidimicrobiia bacterium]|nr:anthranilate phosphoribosyltransferase [Acidimicrobiia bacterium]